MKNYIYDGSFQGFLTVIYTLFLNKELNVNIISNQKNSFILFETVIVETDIEKAKKSSRKNKFIFF